MADEIGRGVIRLSIDGQEVAVGIADIKRSIADLERQAAQSAGNVGQSFTHMAQATVGATQASSQATQRWINSIEREIAAIGSSRAAFREWEAQRKGVAQNVFEPLVQKLDQTKQAQDALAASAAKAAADNSFLESLKKRADAANKTAADLMRLEAAQRGLGAQAEPDIRRIETADTAAGNQKFLSGIDRQTAAIGKSKTELLAYDAALRGIDPAVFNPLIQKLEAAETAHEQLKLAAQKTAADDAFLESLRRQSAAIGKNAEELLRLQAAQRGLGAQAEPHIAAIETGRQQASNEAFIRSMERQTLAMNKSKAELLEYDAIQRGITPAVYAPHVRALKEQEEGLTRLGMTARQTQQAMRLLPAQITDIVTSIASGMPLYLIAIQQGGQIKDSFGGIGAAANALGGYLKNLFSFITPVTAGLGAIAIASGAAVYSFAAASRETDLLNRTIIMTGNAAGISNNSYRDMAQRISQSVGTTSDAIKALVELGNTGRFTGQQMETLGLAAVKMQEATGQAVKDTVAQFVELGKEPVQASLKLNEQYNYLNASVLDQINNLEKEGKAREAATLAVNTFADAIANRSTQVVENLGWIEWGWKKIKDGINAATNAVMNFGRAKTPQQKVEDAEANLKNLEDRREKQKNTSGFTAGFSLGVSDKELAAARQRVDEARNLVQVHREQESIEAAQTEAQRQMVENVKNRIALEEKYGKTKATTEARITKEIERQKNLLGGEWKDEYAKLIRETIDPPKTKTSRPKKPKEYQDDEATRMRIEIAQRNDRLRAQAVEIQNEETLGEAAKARLNFERLIIELKNKPKLTDEQKSVLAAENALRAMLQQGEALEKVNDELKKELALQKLIDKQLKEHADKEAKERAATDAYVEALSENRDATSGGYRREETYGMGDKAKERAEGVNQVNRQHLKDAMRLEKEFATGKISQEAYDTRLAALKAHQEMSLESWIEHFDRVQEAERDATAGASQALNNFLDRAEAHGKQIEDLVTNTFDGLKQVFLDFATSGKLSFKSLRDSILQTMAEIVFDRTVAALLRGMGAGGGGGSKVGVAAGLLGAFTGSGFGSQNDFSPVSDTSGFGSQNDFIPTVHAAGGIQHVPYDGFQATLHQGERVLTRKQAQQPQDGGGSPISVQINMPTNQGAPQMTSMEWARLSRDAVRRGVSEARTRGAKL